MCVRAGVNECVRSSERTREVKFKSSFPHINCTRQSRHRHSTSNCDDFRPAAATRLESVGVLFCEYAARMLCVWYDKRTRRVCVCKTATRCSEAFLHSSAASIHVYAHYDVRFQWESRRTSFMVACERIQSASDRSRTRVLACLCVYVCSMNKSVHQCCTRHIHATHTHTRCAANSPPAQATTKHQNRNITQYAFVSPLHTNKHVRACG